MASDGRAVLHAEDLDAAVLSLIGEAKAMGEAIRAKSHREAAPAVSADIDHILSDSLRQALEDEVVPAVETKQGGLDAVEVEHEVIKKALVGLKVSTLRRLAEEQRLQASGTSEDLATRLGRAYEWDAEAVARLVLANEEEPPADRGHVTRVFPLSDAPSVDHIQSRLSYVLGRYIRIGVARWFVFESAEVGDDGPALSHWFFPVVPDGLGRDRCPANPAPDPEHPCCEDRTDGFEAGVSAGCKFRRLPGGG